MRALPFPSSFLLTPCLSPSPWTFSPSCRFPTAGSVPFSEFPSLVRCLSSFSQLSWTLPKFTAPCHLWDLPLCSSPSFQMSSKDTGPNLGPFPCHLKYCYCFCLHCGNFCPLKQRPAVPPCPQAPMEHLLKSRNHLCRWLRAFCTQPELRSQGRNYPVPFAFQMMEQSKRSTLLCQ